MIIVHRISLRPTDAQRNTLQALGVKLPSGVVPHLTFDVEESHANWGQLEILFREWGVGDLASTRFSSDEVYAAKCLEFVPDWHHGYPQPAEDFGFLQVTYDLTDWCPKCGVGLKQKAPFQMKREPKWGRRGILQLNWVFDEFFVTPEVWSGIFEPRGISYQPVTDAKGTALKTVVQLAVEQEVGILTTGLTPERCARCGRQKYRPVTRGCFPALVVQPTRAIAKTREYFGSGAAADKRVLMSQNLARALVDSGVRGASLRPVAESK